jgi:hypothetical protein
MLRLCPFAELKIRPESGQMPRKHAERSGREPEPCRGEGGASSTPRAPRDLNVEPKTPTDEASAKIDLLCEGRLPSVGLLELILLCWSLEILFAFHRFLHQVHRKVRDGIREKP